MTSSDLSYAVELSDGLEITDTDLSFSDSQILYNNELLDPKQDNEFIDDSDILSTSCCTESNDRDKEESLQGILITVFSFGEV